MNDNTETPIKDEPQAQREKKTKGDDIPIIAKPIKQRFYSGLLNITLTHYGSAAFRAAVVFWPDPDGYFPFDPEYTWSNLLDGVAVVGEELTKL